MSSVLPAKILSIYARSRPSSLRECRSCSSSVSRSGHAVNLSAEVKDKASWGLLPKSTHNLRRWLLIVTLFLFVGRKPVTSRLHCNFTLLRAKVRGSLEARVIVMFTSTLW